MENNTNITKSITNMELITIVNILKTNAEKKFPQRISFAITKNIIGLEKDFEAYEKSLNKIFLQYQDHFVMNEEGDSPMTNEIGVPILDDDAKTKDMIAEINELLAITIEVTLYTISDECFDYEDSEGRYDAVSAQDILQLQTVLCRSEENRN